MTARPPGPCSPPGQRLLSIGRTAALRERTIALWERFGALRERFAALRERIASLWERFAAPRQQTVALRERLAAPGQRRAGVPVGVADRSPPRHIRVTPPEQTAAPREWLSGRWHGLVAIGHADVS